MNLCEHCGSGSRDKDGFCGGCGAPWPLASTAATPGKDAGKHASSFEKFPAQISSAGLIRPQSKIVWVAVLLALSGGPIGLFYSTPLGALVMIVVSCVLGLYLGFASTFIVLPICAIWAWRAARQDSSLFD